MKRFYLLKHFIFIFIATIILPSCSDQNQKVAYYNDAKVCYNNRNYICAREALEKAIQIDPDFVGAYANLGEVYLKLGEISKAFESYSKAAEIDPKQTGFICALPLYTCSTEIS